MFAFYFVGEQILFNPTFCTSVTASKWLPVLVKISICGTKLVDQQRFLQSRRGIYSFLEAREIHQCRGIPLLSVQQNLVALRGATQPAECETSFV